MSCPGGLKNKIACNTRVWHLSRGWSFRLTNADLSIAGGFRPKYWPVAAICDMLSMSLVHFHCEDPVIRSAHSRQQAINLWLVVVHCVPFFCEFAAPKHLSITTTSDTLWDETYAVWENTAKWPLRRALVLGACGEVSWLASAQPTAGTVTPLRISLQRGYSPTRAHVGCVSKGKTAAFLANILRQEGIEYKSHKSANIRPSKVPSFGQFLRHRYIVHWVWYPIIFCD